MSLRRVLLPLVALAIAGGATMTARSWLANRREAPPPVVAAFPDRKAVLVAAKDLETGSFVQPDMVRWQEWPDVGVPDSYYVEGVKTAEDLTGAVARRHIAAGEPLADGMVVKPGERGFLAAVLEPGMRAVSVPVDEAASNAGLILPGDRVDVILTQTLPAEVERGQDRKVSETALADVRVIAMGRRLRSPKDGDQDAPVAESKTVTLEVSPRGAERVALVAELGKLSLSLRSLAAVGPETARPAGEATWDREVSAALRDGAPTTTLALMRGAEMQKVEVRRGTTP